MKILELFSKEVSGRRYYKYTITLPKKVVGESELLGKELKAKLKKGKIIIEEI